MFNNVKIMESISQQFLYIVPFVYVCILIFLYTLSCLRLNTAVNAFWLLLLTVGLVMFGYLQVMFSVYLVPVNYVALFIDMNVSHFLTLCSCGYFAIYYFILLGSQQRLNVENQVAFLNL